MKFFTLVTTLLLSSRIDAAPTVVDSRSNVTYHGLSRNGIDIFLGIPYGQDTGGPNRFKPPKPTTPKQGTIINAQSYGSACPQPLGPGLTPPLTLTNVTSISEDCLNLDVARPSGVCAGSKLPVMIFIHGGSFWSGQTAEITTAPDGLILESIANGLRVIHVVMNYRLGGRFADIRLARSLTLVSSIRFRAVGCTQTRRLRKCRTQRPKTRL